MILSSPKPWQNHLEEQLGKNKEDRMGMNERGGGESERGGSRRKKERGVKIEVEERAR